MVDLDTRNALETPVFEEPKATNDPSRVNRASSGIIWTFSHFNELTAQDWYEISVARETVFIVEQKCAFLDADGADPACWHLVGKVGTQIATYCRIVPPGLKYTEPSIGRVITTLPYRTGGCGKALLTEALRHCDTMFGGLSNKIGAQMYLEKFYASFGYETVSEPYDEDGILHLEMVRWGSSYTAAASAV